MFFATLKLYFSYISAMDCLSNFYCFSGKIISHIASAEKVDPRISKIDMNSIFISRGGRSDHDDGAKKKEIRGRGATITGSGCAFGCTNRVLNISGGLEKPQLRRNNGVMLRSAETDVAVSSNNAYIQLK
jgi:hypothetical protein